MKKKSHKPKNIYITEPDYQRLIGLIEITRERNGVDREYLNNLESEIDRAEIVDPKHVPADVITMRSKVRLKDLVSGEANTYSLVFPTEANFSEGKISILAPIGTAIWVTNGETQLSGPYRPVYADSKLTRSFISRRLRETMSCRTITLGRTSQVVTCPSIIEPYSNVDQRAVNPAGQERLIKQEELRRAL